MSAPTSQQVSYSKDFSGGIMAGAMISLGTAVMLAVENPYVGTLLFSGGLFTVLCLKYNLFTGMLGYFFYNEKISYAKRLAVVLLGNVVGTYLVAILLRTTRLSPALVAGAQAKTAVKLNDSWRSLFVLGFFCNIFVTNAAHQFKYNPHELGKYIAIFVSIMTFVLTGYEHSIADSFLFLLAGDYSLRALGAFLVVVAGNIVGGLIVPTYALYQDESLVLRG